MTSPPNEPVRNTVSVFSKSMNAASFGACELIGCVTNMSAYTNPITDIANTNANTRPTVKISLAWSSSPE
jgi:hypothetical protein